MQLSQALTLVESSSSTATVIVLLELLHCTRVVNVEDATASGQSLLRLVEPKATVLVALAQPSSLAVVPVEF